MAKLSSSDLGNKESNETIVLKRPCSSQLKDRCCKILEDILGKQREQNVMELMKHSLEVTDHSTPQLYQKRMENLFREFNFQNGVLNGWR